MTTIAFDTLKYANKLKAAGTVPEQAEAQAEAIAEVLIEYQAQIEKHWQEKQTATKADISEVKLEIEKLRTETQKSIAETHKAIAESKNEMLKWGAGMLLAQTGLIVTLLKFLNVVF